MRFIGCCAPLYRSKKKILRDDHCRACPLQTNKLPHGVFNLSPLPLLWPGYRTVPFATNAACCYIRWDLFCTVISILICTEAWEIETAEMIMRTLLCSQSIPVLDVARRSSDLALVLFYYLKLNKRIKRTTARQTQGQTKHLRFNSPLFCIATTDVIASLKSFCAHTFSIKLLAFFLLSQTKGSLDK